MITTAFRIVQIQPCAERIAKEKQGLFGFHDSINCADCKKIDDGFCVHAGDSIFAPFVGYYPLPDSIISKEPVFVR